MIWDCFCDIIMSASKLCPVFFPVTTTFSFSASALYMAICCFFRLKCRFLRSAAAARPSASALTVFAA